MATQTRGEAPEKPGGAGRAAKRETRTTPALFFRQMVGELRKVTTWPENLAITTPQDRHPENAVRVSKVSVAARTSPKP